MSYMLDLDEYTEARLVAELRMRQAERMRGNCDYCHRPQGTETSCKFPDRHRGVVEGSEVTQQDVVVWHDREWRNTDDTLASLLQVAGKLCEETGEVMGAAVKDSNGRTDKPWLAQAFDELGDVMVVAQVVAHRLGTTPQIALDARFESVQHRKGSDYR